jgi:RNA polymerase sigma-70 factor (ECF subfamily)
MGGDRAAMRTLLEGVAPIIVRACRRVMGRSDPEVEDVAQQALTAFVDALATFRAESSVAHFAERIAAYRALSARRAAGVRRRLVDVSADGDLAAEDAHDDGPTQEARLAEHHRRGLLGQALAALPEAQAEALALHFLFDHTIGEIAALVGAPAETVRSRLRLGKQALRALITEDVALAALREVIS